MSDEQQASSPEQPGQGGLPEQQEPPAPAGPGGAGAAEAGPPTAPDRRAGPDRGRRAAARQYAARRLGWIGEHSRDDNFLIFIGVAVTAAVAFLVAYGLYREWHREKPRPPVPLPLLFNGKAEEIAPGMVRVAYDFPYDERQPTDREACPQIGDWAGFTLDEKTYRFETVRQGFIVCGGAALRPFFEPGEISVECDAALVTGTHISIVLASIYDNCQGDGYRLSLTAGQRDGWPATAQITMHKDGARCNSSAVATLEDLRAQRNPPLFYRVKLVMSGGRICAWFGKDQDSLKEVCSMDAPEDLGAGKVILTGELSHTAYDNVVITGRPHKEFIAKRTQLYYLFDAPRGRGQGEPAESSAPGPSAESPAPSEELPAPQPPAEPVR
jgi:hypothetical protein